MEQQAISEGRLQLDDDLSNRSDDAFISYLETPSSVQSIRLTQNQVRSTGVNRAHVSTYITKTCIENDEQTIASSMCRTPVSK